MLRRALPLLLLPLLASAQGLFSGAVPEAIPTWTVVYEGNSYNAALKRDGAWIESRDVELQPGERVLIVLDEPWNEERSVATLARNLESVTLENQALRAERLKTGWERAGYELVRNQDGSMQPVIRGSHALAERARYMSSEVMADLHPPADLEVALPTTNSQASGFLQRWGLQVLVGVVGLLLFVAVLKKMVFTD